MVPATMGLGMGSCLSGILAVSLFLAYLGFKNGLNQ